MTVAVIYVGLGEKDIAEHSAQATYYAVAPELDDLRFYPRFKEMLKRLNLPE